MFEEEIKAQLKALGLDENLASQITANSEAEVPLAVMNFAVNRQVQSKVDKRVKEAVDTNSAKLRAEYDAKIAELKNPPADPKQGGDAGKGTGGTGDQTPDISAIIKQAVESATKPLVERIGQIEAESAAKSRSAKVRDALKKAGLPEAAEKYIKVKKDDDIEDAVKGFADDFGALKQKEADAKIPKDGAIPARSDGNAASESLAKNVALARNKSRDASVTTGAIQGIDIAAAAAGGESSQGE